MAAPVGHVDVACPLCGAPLRLPVNMTTGPRVTPGTVPFTVAVDMGPARSHIAYAHPEPKDS